MNNELWRVVASGGLNLLLAEMQSITAIDTRARLLDGRDFLAWLRVELAGPGSLSFAVSDGTLGLLWDEMQADAYYTPALRTQVTPMVENASVSAGTTLVADAAPTGYTIYVWKFNGLLFTQLGTLDAHSEPGSGNYVLACINDDNDALVSLPSSFLTVV